MSIETVQRTIGRRGVIGGSLAAAIFAIVGGTTEARGQICQKQRRKKSRKPRCDGGLKVCPGNGTCVPTNSLCYQGAAYEPCAGNGEFVAGQCCNAGAQCHAATPVC